MIGIIITGHNHFADGIASSARMIAGEQPQFTVVNFEEGINPEDLNTSIVKAMAEVDTGDGVLIFTDLRGGTPFNQASMIAASRDKVEVLTGTNIAMILEASLGRQGVDDLKEYAKALVEMGAEQVDRFDLDALSNNADTSDEDGI